MKRWENRRRKTVVSETVARLFEMLINKIDLNGSILYNRLRFADFIQALHFDADMMILRAFQFFCVTAVI